MEKDIVGLAQGKQEMRKIIDELHEKASSVLEFSLQWEEIDKQFVYTRELLEARAMEVKLKEESLSARIVELEDKEERAREVRLVEENILEKLGALEEKEKEFDLKQVFEASIIRMVLEMENKDAVNQLKSQEKELGLLQDSMTKKYEEAMSELEARKDELSKSMAKQIAEVERRRKEAEMMEESRKQFEAREKEISSLCEAIKEKSAELKKKEETFQMKQKEKAEEIELRSRSLDLKEKKLEEKVKEFELKMRELEGRSIQELSQAKRSRLEFEPVFSSLANKKITGSASTSERISEVNRGEIDINEVNGDPEPFDCPDPDFHDFNRTMNSFAIGQVWALYDPIDEMPRCYAQIMNIYSSQLSLQVTWLEPLKTAEDEESLPIACGRFRYGDTEIKNYLMFSHEMRHSNLNNSVIVNPLIGETWALFRDWDTSNHNPPYMCDFVEVRHDFDDHLGIGVAYLGRVEGFVSVFNHAAQHGVVAFMIPPEEMGRFSHRVPSFRSIGEVKEGVPAGSFELDPAAMPTYMHDDYFMLKDVAEMEPQSKVCGKEAPVVEEQD